MHLWKGAVFFRATGTSKFWISENDTLEDIFVGIELGDFPFFPSKILLVHLCLESSQCCGYVLNFILVLVDIQTIVLKKMPWGGQVV
jgi:hypothetical protein